MTSENHAALRSNADASEVIAALAHALKMLVGSDPLNGLCRHGSADSNGRVKGTWNAAAEDKARTTLQIYSPNIRAALGKSKEA